ncbi:TauD/TfdA family dioxygenase [Erythrobacter sp. THAF29]|uniref:TauD/TfdA family dioxygenase n=1 Tax=Erythrobacter sp. THAF29 TaxID=2587851 RepID=UPI00126846C8|nr:TauD/TfdA family dioxygenase [Erythrobacter sp. THAF29]QFT78853.1 Taurine catabolism dioxygenase TauD, TfdA family [Erythrobacter sp. THAF29]
MTDFPAIITGGGDLAAFLRTNKAAVDAALGEAGALLFRGFDVPDAQAFDTAIEGYGEPGFTYEDSLSNAVRTNVTPRVFTANEAPPTTEIFLHHEMAQTPLYPSKLFFYCEISAQEGGETPVCRSDWVLERLAREAPGFVERLEAHGVRYTNVMPESDDAGSGQGRSWRSTLSVSNRATAEARLGDLGYAWEWQEDDVLQATTPALPAIRVLPDGRRTFFNQLIAAFRGWADSRNDPNRSITFGDGSPITGEDMAPAIEIADELTADISWQAGDVALVDNFLVMHGRRPFKGERRVLASLVA